MWRVGRGKSKFVPGPHHTDVLKIWRNFVGFQQIPLLDLAIFLVKGVLSIDLFSLSMSKVENNVEYPKLKEVPFWAAPPRIGCYREPLPPPLPHPLSHQGITYGSLKINTLTLETVSLLSLSLMEPLLFLTSHSQLGLKTKLYFWLFDALKGKGSGTVRSTKS